MIDRDWPIGTLVWTPTKRMAKVIGWHKDDQRLHLEYFGSSDKRDAVVTLLPKMCQRCPV